MKRFNDQRLFDELSEMVYLFMQNPNNKNNTRNIIKQLDKIFVCTHCKEIIYTNNTDKMFFGMVVMPYIYDEQINNLLLNEKDDNKPINEYYVEIDSKLIELVGLNSRELTACLLHEVGHVVADSTTATKLKKALDRYLGVNDISIDIRNSKKYKDLLRFGLADAFRKVDNVFSQQEEEYIADEFVVACGFGDELESACKKIVKRRGYLNKDVDGKFTVLQWTLNIYTNMKWRRIPAIETLNKSIKYEPSTLIKRNINMAIRDLKRVKDDTYITESFKEFLTDLGYKYAHNTLSTLSDEAYEYDLKVKNLDDYDESLMILREINTRISLLDEYIAKYGSDDSSLKKCELIKERYKKVRYELLKKTTYKEKYYGLFVQTPVIKPNLSNHNVYINK